MNRKEVLALIDECNQYLNGNVTEIGLMEALSDTLNKVVNELTKK